MPNRPATTPDRRQFVNAAVGSLATMAVASHAQATPAADRPVRVGVVGLVHSHVHGLLGRKPQGDVEVVGIAEPNGELAKRMSRRHGFAMELVHDSLEAMLDAAKPEAVVVFTSIRAHRPVTETCAARGIHVMVEKPLAVSLTDATAMAAAARQAGVLLLTNYETTWYPSVHELGRRVRAGEIGPLRKLVVHDGHPGPQEIGVDPEFLEWLIDPVENGAGALTDFGCYGADLATWLMEGRRPTSVTAVTQQIKPEIYPLVDDEATIIVTYPQCQAVLQASWNWPVNRKDMEAYGRTGFIHADDATHMRSRVDERSPLLTAEAAPRPAPEHDPFAYFAAAIRGQFDSAGSLSGLDTNLVAMEILDAAIRSAREGRTIELADAS